MQPLDIVTGVGVPLRRANVDTDQIIPAVYLKRTTRTGFDDACFHAWRRDPAFILNQPAYANARILVAGPDFGIGSSREHAVWALRDYGFSVILAPRFGDIFRGNTAKNGILAATLPEESIHTLWNVLEAHPGIDMTVNLDARTVTCADITLPIEVGDYERWRLMNGYDDIDLTLRYESEIAAYEQQRAQRLPFMPTTLPARTDAPQPVASARVDDDVDATHAWTGPHSLRA